MAEMTSVSGTLHNLAESSPPMLPRFCSVRFTQTPAPGNHGGTMEVIHLRYSWATLHEIDSVSRSVLSQVESRFLSRVPDPPRPDTSRSTGGPPSPGSSHAGGSRPPAAPSGTRGSGATPPTSRRKNKRPASADLLPVASNRSIRSLRSQRLNERLAQAHEAAMAAFIEEDARATVVQPHYSVFEVEPMLLWPNGGVLVYAQFPFLLDESWRTPGLCLSYCRKVLCDPDPRNMGGTYETIFSMNKADIEREQEAAARRDSARQDPTALDASAGPPASPTPSTPTSQPTPRTPSAPATPPVTADGVAPTPTAGAERAVTAAARSMQPALSAGGGLPTDYDGLPEEELDLGQLPDLTLGSTPPSDGMSLLGASPPAAAAAAGTRVETATANVSADVPPRVPFPLSPSTLGAPAAPPRPDGPAGNSSSSADRNAPETPSTARERDSAAVPAAAVSALAPGQSPADSPARDTPQPVATPGRPPRQRESSPVTADEPEVRQRATVSASVALHNDFLKAVHVCNADIGFDAGQTIRIKKVAGSPKASFSMRCAFVSAMDLDTSKVTSTTVRTDQFIVAAYRARPGLSSAPINLCD